MFRFRAKDRNDYGASYRRAISRQLFLRGERGYEAAVGGAFDEYGARERDVVDAAGLGDEGLIVDVGCGSGRLAAALKDRPKLQYIGLDVSPQLLQRAQQLCARPDWRFEQVTQPAIPATANAVNLVSMFSLITHLPADETRAYFREAARVLKPGGALVCSFLDPEVPAHRKMLRPALVEAIVTRLFWAPNVATTAEEMAQFAAEAGLSVEKIESPSAFGQSLAVMRKPGADSTPR
jgi:ubiquinone/menaquinone biosynthesis C-methylase UbiE